MKFISKATCKRDLIVACAKERDTVLPDLGKPFERIYLTFDNWNYEHIKYEFISVTTH